MHETCFFSSFLCQNLNKIKFVSNLLVGQNVLLPLVLYATWLWSCVFTSPLSVWSVLSHLHRSLINALSRLLCCHWLSPRSSTHSSPSSCGLRVPLLSGSPSESSCYLAPSGSSGCRRSADAQRALHPDLRAARQVTMARSCRWSCVRGHLGEETTRGDIYICVL